MLLIDQQVDLMYQRLFEDTISTIYDVDADYDSKLLLYNYLKHAYHKRRKARGYEVDMKRVDARIKFLDNEVKTTVTLPGDRFKTYTNIKHIKWEPFNASN